MNFAQLALQPDIFLVWTSLVKTLFILFGVVLPLVSLAVFAERKVCAFIQDRVGPNRVGFPATIFGFKKDLKLWGLGQMVADPIKLLLKENFIPSTVNKFYYYIAPKLTMIPPILVFAVLPFGSTLLWGARRQAGADGHRQCQYRHPFRFRGLLARRSTASCSRAGRRTRNIRSLAVFAPVRR